MGARAVRTSDGRVSAASTRAAGEGKWWRGRQTRSVSPADRVLEPHVFLSSSGERVGELHYCTRFRWAAQTSLGALARLIVSRVCDEDANARECLSKL
jgi:hypothetical protein